MIRSVLGCIGVSVLGGLLRPSMLAQIFLSRILPFSSTDYLLGDILGGL